MPRFFLSIVLLLPAACNGAQTLVDIHVQFPRAIAPEARGLTTNIGIAGDDEEATQLLPETFCFDALPTGEADAPEISLVQMVFVFPKCVERASISASVSTAPSCGDQSEELLGTATDEIPLTCTPIFPPSHAEDAPTALLVIAGP